MRHSKHRHQLGVKKEHRLALMANLAVALFSHGRIQTTLAKAKALRPFAEKVITLAKSAAQTEDPAKKLHYRRQVIARIRDVKIVAKLFDERAQEFLNRPGGYTRIYKLVPRKGDAAAMALIELIEAADEGYKSKRKKKQPTSKKAEPRAKASDEKAEEASDKEGNKPSAKKTTKKKTTKKVADKKEDKPSETGTGEQED